LANLDYSDAWDVFVVPLVQISGSQKKASSSGLHDPKCPAILQLSNLPCTLLHFG